MGPLPDLGGGAQAGAPAPQEPLTLRSAWTTNGLRMARWSPRSRRRLQAAQRRMSVALRPALSPSCTHLRGRGGVKGAVRRVHRALPQARYVARFDVAAYYFHIRHETLLAQLRAAHIAPADVSLVQSYLTLPAEADASVGLSASGPLSPLLAGLYLAPLDHAMDRLVRRRQLLTYVRYVDDVVLLARSRWQLRRAIARLHAILSRLGLRTHRKKKCFIGQPLQGFDFLGYRFHPRRRLRASRESLRRFRTRARRLYEQGADEDRLRQYVEHWQRWLLGGLGDAVGQRGGTTEKLRGISCAHASSNMATNQEAPRRHPPSLRQRERWP